MAFIPVDQVMSPATVNTTPLIIGQFRAGFGQMDRKLIAGGPMTLFKC